MNMGVEKWPVMLPVLRAVTAGAGITVQDRRNLERLCGWNSGQEKLGLNERSVANLWSHLGETRNDTLARGGPVRIYQKPEGTQAIHRRPPSWMKRVVP